MFRGIIRDLLMDTTTKTMWCKNEDEAKKMTNEKIIRLEQIRKSSGRFEIECIEEQTEAEKLFGKIKDKKITLTINDLQMFN